MKPFESVTGPVHLRCPVDPDPVEKQQAQTVSNDCPVRFVVATVHLCSQFKVLVLRHPVRLVSHPAFVKQPAGIEAVESPSAASRWRTFLKRIFTLQLIISEKIFFTFRHEQPFSELKVVRGCGRAVDLNCSWNTWNTPWVGTLSLTTNFSNSCLLSPLLTFWPCSFLPCHHAFSSSASPSNAHTQHTLSFTLSVCGSIIQCLWPGILWRKKASSLWQARLEQGGGARLAGRQRDE